MLNDWYSIFFNLIIKPVYIYQNSTHGPAWFLYVELLLACSSPGFIPSTARMKQSKLHCTCATSVCTANISIYVHIYMLKINLKYLGSIRVSQKLVCPLHFSLYLKAPKPLKILLLNIFTPWSQFLSSAGWKSAKCCRKLELWFLGKRLGMPVYIAAFTSTEATSVPQTTVRRWH